MASIVERVSAKTGKVTSVQVRWRRNGHTETYKLATRDDAEKFAKLLEQCNNDAAKVERILLGSNATTPTLAEFAEIHLNSLSDVEPHTVRTYRGMLRLHIVPAMGELPIGEIDEDDIAAFISELRREKRLSPKTVANIHSLLYAIFDTGVRRKRVPSNPCIGTRLPKADHTADKETYLTHKEFAHLMSHMDPHFRPFFVFLVSTGLRFSEAAALTGPDFTDADGKYSVRVTKAWKRDDIKGRYIGPPKSRKSIRTVAVPAEVALMLAPLVQEAGRDGLVFRMKRGGAVTWASIHSKAWQPAILKAQAEGFRKKPRVHDLRHTYASWQLATGDMSIFELSLHMGHESVTTTANVYSHLMPEAIEKASATASKALGGLFTPAPAVALEA